MDASTDGLWAVCGLCGALVADVDKHEQWHAAFADALTEEV